MNKHIKVSVIIPAYNAEAFIHRSIKAVFSQVMKDIQLIVIDDGSKDNTYNVVKSIFDKNIKCGVKCTLLKQPNLGVSCARNNGLAQAEGQFVHFLDADDIIFPDFFLKLFRKATKYNADVVFAGYDRIDEEGKVITRYNDLFAYPNSEVLSGVDVLKLLLKDRISIWTASAIYRRKNILKHGIKFTPGSTNGEDTEFIMKALFHSKTVASVKESLAYYVQRTGSANKLCSTKQFHSVGSVTRLISYLSKNNASEDILRLLNKRRLPMVVLNVIFKLSMCQEKSSEFIPIFKNKSLRKTVGEFVPMNFSIRELSFYALSRIYKCTPQIFVKLIRVLKKIFSS